MKFRVLVFIFIIISTLFLVISLLSPHVIIDNKEINFNGEDTYNIKAYNVLGDISKYIKVRDNIDRSTIGSYDVVVSVRYLFFRYDRVFKIKVCDKNRPTISLMGNDSSLVCPNGDYDEEGFTATDDYDGDITDRVMVNYFDDFVMYSVKDSSGNYFETKRKLIFEDNEKPSIEIKGGNRVTIYRGSNYVDSGALANDNCDGDISDKILSTGNVDSNKVGEYTIVYKVTDSSGNTSSAERVITVINRPYYYGNGVIYLTFDDGPSYLTGRILDILDEENVKATFFVTSGGDYVVRAYNSGHTIALHTASHLYSYIYANEYNYFNDLSKVSDDVYYAIGIRSNIIRFPGGSSNTVSRNYNRGIMSRLTMEVVSRGYNYFDWNVDSNDAGSDINDSTRIYNNVIRGLSHNKTNIVLMHDSASHMATLNALRDIIDYGKSNGYSFRAIDSSTPSVRHLVNN